MNWISRYEKVLLNKLLPDSSSYSELEYLRIVIFLKCIFFLLPSAIIVLIPCYFYLIALNQETMFLIDIITYFLLIFLIGPVKINIEIKKIIFTLAMYHLSYQLLFRLDSLIFGLLYWFITNLGIILIFTKRTTIIVLALNIAFSLIIALLLKINDPVYNLNAYITYDAWIVIALNMFFLNTLISILINHILISLQNKISSQIENGKELANMVNLLQSKNEELEHMTYVASHDLQEPLRMVTSFLSQLDNKYKDQLDQRGKQYIHFAMNGAVKMREVMLEILAFSKIGMDESQIESINLNELVEEVLWMNRKLIQENNNQIIIDQLPIMIGHKILLRTLFTNLISNAVKYKSNARISIIKLACTIEENDFVFKVIDNGIGIPDEKKDQIFQLFNRGDVNKNQIQGSGIGLAICKKITLLMNGEISVSSIYNEGCTFIVRLPKTIKVN